MSLPSLTNTDIRDLEASAATGYDESAFKDVGDEEDEDVVSFARHRRGDSPKRYRASGGSKTKASIDALSKLLSDREAIKGTPLQELVDLNSSQPPNPPTRPPLADRQNAAKRLRDRRERRFPDGGGENRIDIFDFFCQGEVSDVIVQAALHPGGEVEATCEVGTGLTTKEKVKFEVIETKQIWEEILLRGVPFGLIRVDNQEELSSKVLHVAGRQCLTNLVRVAGQNACLLLSFTGPVDTNQSCLVVAPSNMKLPRDLRQGRIAYSPWSYVKKAHVDQLAEDAVSYPQPLQHPIKWHATHYFKPLKKGVKIEDFEAAVREIFEKSKPTSTVDLTQLDLLNLVDLKQTHLEGLGKILASTVEEALGKDNFFGTCAGVVGEGGEVQMVVVISKMVERTEKVQEEIGQVKERMFGGKLDRKQMFWEEFEGQKEGEGTDYFRVFASGARDIPKDVCFGMGQVLLGARGRAGGIVSVVYLLKNNLEGNPEVDILSTFAYSRSILDSDFSPPSLEFGIPLSISRVSLQVRENGDPDMNIYEPKPRTKNSKAIDFSTLVKMYDDFLEIAIASPLLSFWKTDRSAKEELLKGISDFKGKARLSKGRATKLLDYAYGCLSDDEHQKRREEGSVYAESSQAIQGVEEDNRARKREHDEEARLKGTVSSSKWDDGDAKFGGPSAGAF